MTFSVVAEGRQADKGLVSAITWLQREELKIKQTLWLLHTEFFQSPVGLTSLACKIEKTSQW